MKVFVAGGSGAVGTRLVPALIAAGHEVVATTRSAGKTDRLRELGAEPIVVDGLDRKATIAAVRDSAAQAVVHQLTALSGATNFRRFDQEFALTNRLRTEGTDNLLAGARAAGVRHFVAQSFAGWPYAREGGAPGVYNVVDDEPARVSEWLPYLAQVIGAPPPRRVPVWLGRLAAGGVGVSMMTQIR